MNRIEGDPPPLFRREFSGDELDDPYANTVGDGVAMRLVGPAEEGSGNTGQVESGFGTRVSVSGPMTRTVNNKLSIYIEIKVSFSSPDYGPIMKGGRITDFNVTAQWAKDFRRPGLSDNYVRAIILLHELGHVMGKFGPDARNPKKNNRNTRAVVDHCV